jgi:hypothetical protein
MRKAKAHELKILTEFFVQQSKGTKRFEIRRFDRDFSVDDTLILNEGDGKSYTGRCIVVLITYLLSGCQFEGIERGYVVMGTSEAIEEVI